MGARGPHFSEHSSLCQPWQVCLNSLHKAVCNLLLFPFILCHTEPLQIGGNKGINMQLTVMGR